MKRIFNFALLLLTCLGAGIAANAATLTPGYTIGGGQLGPSMIVDNANTGGGDSSAAGGDPGWTAELTGLWNSNATVTITGVALPIWSDSSSASTTVSGTFTFYFYDLDEGLNTNGFDGIGLETLLGTATATFIQGSVGTYYAIFDTPVTFTARSTGVAVRITNTGWLRLKIATAVNAPGVVRKDSITGSVIGGNQPNFRISLAGTAPSIARKIADYQDDFRTGSFPPGWHYLWNQPAGWPASPDNRTGTIGDPASYANLRSSGNTYTPDGDSNFENNSPAGYLQLTGNGGHPGKAAGAAGGRDRYAIAAYTVSSSGFYQITHSKLQGSAGSSGLHSVVHVDSRPFALELLAVDDTLYAFNTDLGWLDAGQTIYVGVGPAGDPAYDSFKLDFTIETYDPAVTKFSPPLITRYSRAFTGSASQTNGWSFVWNAPTNWAFSGSGGNSTSGGIDSGTPYQPLVRSGDTFTPDGDLNFLNNPPVSGLRLYSNGGHPGPAGVYGTMSRYAIAQYTVPRAGKYLIGQSFLELGTNSNDGVEVMVLVNGVRQYTKTVMPGERGRFEGELGPLTTNDLIQVAVGPRGNDTGDDFTWDFEIAYATSCFDSTTQVINIADYGAVGNGTTDDGPAIRSAIAAAANSGAPTIIDFDGTKTYRVTSFTSDFAIYVSDRQNIYLRGNGATLSIPPPKRAIYIDRSQNIKIEGFTLICNPLPYFQADIVGYDTAAGTVDIQVWTNYPMPAVDAPSVTDNSATWVFGQRFGNHAGHFWIKTIKEIDAANTADRILRVTAQSQSANDVADVGQESAGLIIPVPGKGQTGNFLIKIQESSQVHFRDMVIHQAPQFIILPYGNRGPVRFENVDLVVPAGTRERLVSWRDGFHVKNNRYGPIWEDCEFDGWAMQDDLFNLTANWGFVDTINSDHPMIIVNFTGNEGDPWGTGDWLTAEQLNGNTKGSARVAYSVASGGKYYIELDREIPGLAVGDRLYDEEASNRGAAIRRCRTYAGDAGTATWRQRTPVLIEDNYFQDFYLWINGEWDAEGPVPEDITIRRNTFKGSGRFIDTGYDSGQRATRNIVFLDNLFDHPSVGLHLAYDVLFAGNNFIVSGSDNAVGMNDAGPATFVGNWVNGAAPDNLLSYINRVGGTTVSDILQRNALALTAQIAPDGQIALNWTPGLGATNYNVLRSMTNGGPYTVAAHVGTDTSYLDSVINGFRYYYKIECLGMDGTSAFSSQVDINLPANASPVVDKIPDYTVSPGMTLKFSIPGRDTNTPPSALAFSLLVGPAGATLNLTNGIFTWRTTEADADTTNQVTVQVSNSGTPPLSVTQSFFIRVVGVGEPASVSFQAGGLQLNGAVISPGYTVQDIHILSSSPALSDTSALISGNQYNASGARIHRSLLAFDLSPLIELISGSEINIQDIQLTMTNYAIHLGPGITGISQELHLTDAFSPGANWNTTDGVNPWPTAGGTLGDLLSSTTTGTVGAQSWLSGSNFIAAANAVLAGTDHKLYLLLKGKTDSNQDNRSQFRNSGWTNLAERPQLNMRFAIQLPPKPALSWRLTSNGCEVFWPSSYTDYVLEASSELISGTWTNVTGVVSNRYEFTPMGDKSFFRLKQTP